MARPDELWYQDPANLRVVRNGSGEVMAECPDEGPAKYFVTMANRHLSARGRREAQVLSLARSVADWSKHGPSASLDRRISNLARAIELMDETKEG